LAGEAAADYQQLVYQTEKYRRRAAREPAGAYARGFIETGLWSWSRWVHGDTLPSRLYCVARCCTVLQGVVLCCNVPLQPLRARCTHLSFPPRNGRLYIQPMARALGSHSVHPITAT
jgi:hypothetical protein